MKELLLEYLVEKNQVEQFKTWLIGQEIDTEGGVEAWVDSEIENLLENPAESL
jgi:hypothetical protein